MHQNVITTRVYRRIRGKRENLFSRRITEMIKMNIEEEGNSREKLKILLILR